LLAGEELEIPNWSQPQFPDLLRSALQGRLEVERRQFPIPQYRLHKDDIILEQLETRRLLRRGEFAAAAAPTDVGAFFGTTMQ
jgi:hypothetical protein